MGDIWELPIYVKVHICHIKSFNMPLLIEVPTLPHMLHGYEICLNSTLSDIKYARCQILVVQLHIGLFWSAGIPTVYLTLPA